MKEVRHLGGGQQISLAFPTPGHKKSTWGVTLPNNAGMSQTAVWFEYTNCHNTRAHTQNHCTNICTETTSTRRQRKYTCLVNVHRQHPSTHASHVCGSNAEGSPISSETSYVITRPDFRQCWRRSSRCSLLSSRAAASSASPLTTTSVAAKDHLGVRSG